MARRRTICLNDCEYEALLKAKAKHELESGTRLDGFGAAVALLAGLYLLGRFQQEQSGQQGENRPLGIPLGRETGVG